MVLELILLSLLTLIINGLIFWLYYIRTKRIIWKVREVDQQLSFRNLLARVEHRLAKPLPYWSRNTTELNPWAIVFTYERQEMLDRTLKSLRRHEPSLKILVVDNGSKDGTVEMLSTYQQSGQIDKLLLNTHAHIPQWQKAFALHQAVNLLAIHEPSHFLFLDDDIEVRKPFLNFGVAALDRLADRGVKLVSFMTDWVQNTVHFTVEHVPFMDEDIMLKRSFNGACFLLKIETLDQFGLPPIGEGSDEVAAEDWYFSRRLHSLNGFAACVDFAEHLGAAESKRVSMETTRTFD